MTVFIVTPPDYEGINVSEDMPDDQSAAGRRERIEALLAYRLSEKVGGDTAERIETGKSIGFDVIADPIRRLPLTGATIIRADDDALSPLREQFPNHRVRRDSSFNITEAPTEVLAVEEGAQGAPWHLDMVGIALARDYGMKLEGRGVVVAVIDTGVTSVAGFGGRVKATSRFDPNSRTLYDSSDSQDSYNHGTRVADLIGGADNGVAPLCTMLDIHAAPNGIVYSSALTQAFELVAGNASVSIVNISLGRPSWREELLSSYNTMTASGVLSVAAIGNDGRGRYRSPGAFRSSLSVGAVNPRGESFKLSGGAEMIDADGPYRVPTLVAPGVEVPTTDDVGRISLSTGTSMATPIVAGMAALVKEHLPGATAATIRNALLSDCIDLNLPDTEQGAGLLAVPRAINPASVGV